MILKCFGGPFDQQRQSVDGNRAKQGEIFRFTKMPSLSVADFDPNNKSEIVTYEHYHYVVETMRCKSETLRFLRYSEISIEETFFRIFT